MKSYLMIAPTVNPVLTPEFAAKISKSVDVAHFDIHVHLEDMFSGTNAAFLADMYSRCAWRLDAQLRNTLKQVARELPTHEGVNSIDNYSEVRDALDGMWNSENHGFEIGYEGIGPLHMITAIRNVRESWLDHARRADMARGRLNAKGVLSIETQIASPQKTEVSSQQIQNFEFEALKLVGGLSDIKLRGHFRDAINYAQSLEIIERTKREANKSASDEQIGMWCAQDDEFKELLAKYTALPANALRAFKHRQALIDDQEQKHNAWYEAEIKQVGVQLQVYDYCVQHMHDVGEHQVEFYDLPNALQVVVCNDACVSLDTTLSKFSSKATSLYCTYSLIVDEAKALISRVIAARCDDAAGYAVTETGVEEALARSNARRAKHHEADK